MCGGWEVCCSVCDIVQHRIHGYHYRVWLYGFILVGVRKTYCPGFATLRTSPPPLLQPFSTCLLLPAACK